MKSASMIVLLLVSAASAQSDNHEHEMYGCSDVFMRAETACKDDGDMEECFQTCMNKRGVDHVDRPECPGLTDALCACGNECTSSDTCKTEMIAALNCNLANQYDCKDYTCNTAFSVLDEGTAEF
mmetsp:Transcript_20843/g.38235  ORF Transcript_20843/g.38235 Transcript_20843/m.38235 type:complete len:125 (-) Transcript_20843:107-481(-)